MANHDFLCPVCATVFFDVWVPTGDRASAAAPRCYCGTRTEWVPGRTAMDASSGPGFDAFSCFDGRNEPVRIDSLQTLRRVERESEILARNGEGQQIVFRAWANQRTNREVNTLGVAPSQRPRPEFVEKFGPCVKTAEAPDLAFGPGVSEENCSALQGGVESPASESES